MLLLSSKVRLFPFIQPAHPQSNKTPPEQGVGRKTPPAGFFFTFLLQIVSMSMHLKLFCALIYSFIPLPRNLYVIYI